MCPACLGLSTWLIAGGVSTGGAITLVVNRYMRKTANERKHKPLLKTPTNPDIHR